MRLYFVALSSLAAASLFAGSLPVNEVRGEYVEARTADVYTGPCFANSETGSAGDLAVMGWKIDRGEWHGVKLDGLAVIGVVRASATLGDPKESAYPVRAVLIIDDHATAEQRLALRQFAQRAGNGLLNDVVRVDYRPIAFELAHNSIHSMRVKMVAGNLAKIETRPLDGGDKICHNEEVWYQPLTNVDHAMAAYTIEEAYAGSGLGTTWSSPDKRSAFVAGFDVRD